MPNRLAAETSPYLLQHSDNPVDWHPWGEEAFALARAEQKPIFVSIGYAACHWCHVMAHESFEDGETARLMNELFVNVKVDREERPDVDAVYMTALQALGQGGGWPLSAFCTAEGKPYFLGTYFPPADGHGRPGFRRVLQHVAHLYRDQPDQVEANAGALLGALAEIDARFRGASNANGSSADAGLAADRIVEAGRWLAQRADPRHGGLGGAPKFPTPSSHGLLGRAGRLGLGDPAREAFLRQCRGMARGGIRDHLGGGFARYSVDERWLVPHFEKMLYDNGQLLGIYADAFAITGADEYTQVIRETVVWLRRELQDPNGGLYSSLDADSDGVEGKFYVWRPEQVREALDGPDAELICRHYGVTEAGNFEDGQTVLSRVTEIGSSEEEARLVRARAQLLAARSARVRPATDTKILAGWNGLAVTGLVRAWEATGQREALDLAVQVAQFLADRMVHSEGRRIWRVFVEGVESAEDPGALDGTIDDYAFVAEAFLALAEALEEEVWWRRGSLLLESLVERFYSETEGVGVFHMTPHDVQANLVHRPESTVDGAIPAGAATAVACLVRLGEIAGDRRAAGIAESYLRCRVPELPPPMAGRLLAALDDRLHLAVVVVSEGTGRDELLRAARSCYAPARALAGPWASQSILAGKEPAADGRARAFICRGQTCSEPVGDANAVREPLRRRERLPLGGRSA